MITLCTDAAPIVSWVNNRYNSQGGTDQLSLESVTIFNTNAQCKFPDSTYSGAHIVYVIGKQLPERGTSTINWLINSGVTYYNNATASYSLLDIVFSQDPISYDLNTNTLITQNQDIINQNQTIINQNTQTNEKLDNIEDSITSEESPDPYRFPHNRRPICRQVRFLRSVCMTDAYGHAVRRRSRIASGLRPIPLFLPQPGCHPEL